MPGGPDSFLEVALEYRNRGIETTFDFLYDEWKRRYVPPHLDPHSSQLVVSPSPKPVYQAKYSEESPRTGRAFLFGFVTFVLLTNQFFRWWDGERGLPLRAYLCFFALVYGSLYALCEITSIYQLVALDLILFVIVYVSITFGSPESFP